MAVCVCCPYDCKYKHIAKNVVIELNKVGIKTFYNGDIPEDWRWNGKFGGPAIRALIQSPVFVPILFEGFTRSSMCNRELAYALKWEKCIIPLLVDGHYLSTEFRNLLEGVRIVDMSSTEARNAELPGLIEAIRVMIPDIRISSDMSVCVSCPFDCQYNDNYDIARNVVGELNKSGIRTFFNGDIQEKNRPDGEFGGPFVQALIQSPVFVPILCKEFTRSLCSRELTNAMQYEKCIIPILVDGHTNLSTEVRNLLEGVRIVDMSSTEARNTELPGLIESLQVMIPVLIANYRSVKPTVPECVADSAEGEEVDSSDESDYDWDGNETWSAVLVTN